MNKKLWFLTKNSFQKKVKSKWFVIANIIIAIALIGIINMDKVITFFGGDFDDTIEIVLVDESNSLKDILISNLEETNNLFSNTNKFKVENADSKVEDEKKELKTTGKILIVLTPDEENYLKSEVISYDLIDTVTYQVIYQALNTTKQMVAMSNTSIDLEELAKISSNIDVERVVLNEDTETIENNMDVIMGTVFPTLILPFFILVVFLVQMIGTEINEEKSTRSMEIIISNVSPKTHFLSKMLASNGFILLQAILLIIYSAIGLLIYKVTTPNGTTSVFSMFGDIINTLTETGVIDKLIYIIPVTLILMILSFFTYSLVAGILASMTVNMEDFQQIQTPIMLVCLLGYYLSIMASLFNGSIFIKILSYIPFISCLLSPALLILGQITILDTTIAILLLVITNYLLLKYGLRIYKVGILNYSTDKMWSKIFKAVKEK